MSEDEKEKSYIAQSRAVFQISYVIANNVWIESEKLYLPSGLIARSGIFISHPSGLSCPKPYLEFAAFDQVGIFQLYITHFFALGIKLVKAKSDQLAMPKFLFMFVFAEAIKRPKHCGF